MKSNAAKKIFLPVYGPIALGMTFVFQMTANVKPLATMVLYVHCGVQPHAQTPKSYAKEEKTPMDVKNPMFVLIDQLAMITLYAQDIAL